MEEKKRKRTKVAAPTKNKKVKIPKAVKKYIAWYQQDDGFLETAQELDQIIFNLTQEMHNQPELGVRKESMKNITFLTRVKTFFYRIGIHPEMQKR